MSRVLVAMCVCRRMSFACLLPQPAPYLRRAPLPVPSDRAGDQRQTVTQEVVWVSVADAGIGIAPDDMPKLFQEFSQVESSASRQAQGTGLGLGLSKRFVELRGGTIGAESIPSRGSTFWFMLPTEGPIRRISVSNAA